MATGLRFGTTPSARVRSGQAATMPTSTPVTIVNEPARLEYRYPRLTGEAMATEFAGAAIVATLAGPATDEEFVLERLCVSGSGASAVYVLVGGLGARDVIDRGEPAGRDFLPSSDAEPIRVPANNAVHIVWVGATDTCTARLQVRVEGD